MAASRHRRCVSTLWGINPAAAGIASAVGFTRGDVAYMLVIVWAFVGIAVKHAATPLVATAAWVTAALVVVMLVVGWLRHRKLAAT